LSHPWDQWSKVLHLTDTFVSFIVDGKNDGRKTVADLVIDIQDVNDDPPAFSPDGKCWYRILIFEMYISYSSHVTAFGWLARYLMIDS
jgi:hypothetical protein